MDAPTTLCLTSRPRVPVRRRPTVVGRRAGQARLTHRGEALATRVTTAGNACRGGAARERRPAPPARRAGPGRLLRPGGARAARGVAGGPPPGDRGGGGGGGGGAGRAGGPPPRSPAPASCRPPRAGASSAT